ncbi:MAG: Calx-beta domain-containing protein [Bacteroidota bacterium]
MTGSFTSNSPSSLFSKFISFTFIAALLSMPMGLKAQDLRITGLFDGPLSSGTPKAIEFYATANIADLSVYGMGKAINGGGSNGQEYTFPAVSVSAGEFVYLATDSMQFNAFFGFEPNFNDSFIPNNNGDDAIELYFNGNVIDRFGDLMNDGTGTLWEYLDGWAYRKNGTGPDGTDFFVNNWNYSGPNAIDGESTNASAMTPFPLGSYSLTGTGDFSFSSANYLITEDGGTLQVPVELSIGENTCSVDVILDGSSTADASDFSLSLPVTLNFNATSMTTTVVQNLMIPIVDDMMEEMDEAIVLKLTNITGSCGIGTSDSTTIIIEDNDTPPEAQKLLISGVLDGPLSGGTKGIELYAYGDISDLSQYGIGSANNGDGSDGEEFTLPVMPLDSGNCVYITNDEDNFLAFMGFAADFENVAANVNGDDAIELYQNGVVVDIFGEPYQDGTGTAWEYLDGWTYRNSGTGPDGSTFVIGNWSFSGVNAMDNETSNSTADVPFPTCSYSPIAPAEPQFSFATAAASVNEGDGSVDITINISSAADCNIDIAVGIGSSATLGDDFTFTSPTTVSFTSGGPTSMTVNIPLVDDSDVEGEEAIIFVLQNPSGGATCEIGSPDQFTITVEDNDVAVVNIVDVHGEDMDGNALSDGSLVQLTGVVHCIDFDGNEGYSFHILDETGGINVFSFSDVDSYVVTEGDNITVTGVIDQFRGLTEIIPDEIVLNSTGNALTPPVVVTALDESTESIPVTLQNVSLVDEAAWTTGAGGFGFIVFVENGSSDQFEVFIDSDSELYNAPAPMGNFNISGIGSQRTESTAPPFTDGYRIQPCSNADITPVVSIEAPEWSEQIEVFPNPVTNYLDVRTPGVELNVIRITDVLGRQIMVDVNPETVERYATSALPSGVYLITFQNTEGTYTQQFVKQ